MWVLILVISVFPLDAFIRWLSPSCERYILLLKTSQTRFSLKRKPRCNGLQFPIVILTNLPLFTLARLASSSIHHQWPEAFSPTEKAKQSIPMLYAWYGIHPQVTVQTPPRSISPSKHKFPWPSSNENPDTVAELLGRNSWGVFFYTH